MKDEMTSIWSNETWTLAPLSPGTKAITYKWIFKLKPAQGTQPPRKKARLVARGFEQRRGIDFSETFAVVIKWATIRTAVALAATKRWNIYHMDVRTAFLNGLLKETVFMRQPPGFAQPGQEKLVCKLQKSLYGLKQSPRAWYEKIDTVLKKLGLQRSTSDGNMYFMHKDGDTLILMLYVDDLFIIGSSDRLISWLKTFLHKEFNMTDLGMVKRYLGISFKNVPPGIFLHQCDYALSILTDFGMAQCKSAPSPLPEGLVLVTNMDSPYVDSTYYCKLVGKLIFLTITRPDLAYAVSRVSSYMANPQQTHLDAAKYILHYIHGTINHGILYRAGSPLEAIGFTDVDWGSCPETRRSMGAYIFTLAGGPISWQSKRQITVSRSSTESEYCALSDGAQEAVWLHRLLIELHVTPPKLSSSSSPILHTTHSIKIF
jgi:hypothetical protein